MRGRAGSEPQAASTALPSGARWRGASLPAIGPARGACFHRTGTRRPSRGRAQQLAIPRNGEVESLVELEQRSPSQLGARLLGAQVLALNLVSGFVADVRFGVRSHQVQDPLREVEHRDRLLVREMERLPNELSVLR